MNVIANYMLGGFTLSWLVENKEWFFSGLGVTLLGAVGYFIKRKLDKNKLGQTITSGDDSTNIQGGNDVKVTIGEKMLGDKKEISAGDSSTNIQGNEVTVHQNSGMDYLQVRQVVMDVF